MASVLTRMARRRGDLRSEEQLREHYRIERELADRLRTSTRHERRRLYRMVYDELLQRVPHHPRLCEKHDDDWCRQRGREIERQIRFLGRFLSLRTVFLEVGAGDCALALRVCDFAERVYAVDVSSTAIGASRPANLSFVFTNGTDLAVPERSVDVVFSNQLLEHLHPDDALEQTRSIYAALAPGGIYVCVTPNRLYGPCDVSGYFEDRPTGLHLHEYSSREMRALLAAQGFTRVRFYCGARGWFVPCPYWILAGVESVLERLPARLRRRLADTAPMRALLGLRFSAVKPG